MQLPREPNHIKIVLIGNSGAGKTCLVTNYIHSIFDDKHVPNVLDVYQGKVTIKDKEFDLEIFDTSGDAQLGQDRQLMYHNTDCFILCTAVSSIQINRAGDIRAEMEHGISSFKNEVRSVRQDTPIVLFGTKTDLRTIDEDAISFEEL